MAVMPAPGSFQSTGSLVTARSDGALAELQDGRILVAGGTGQAAGGLTAAELYDPTTGQFTSTGPLGSPRHQPQAVTLNDGRVLVMGFDDLLSPSTELYNPATGEFVPGPSATNGGAWGMSLLGDGRVFVITGFTMAELFDPTTDTFTVAGSMGVARGAPGVVPLLDDRVFVVGGVGRVRGGSRRRSSIRRQGCSRLLARWPRFIC